MGSTHFSKRYPVDTLTLCNIEKICVDVDCRLFHAMEAIEMASEYGLPTGLSIVQDKDMSLVGVVTDGDIREALLKGSGIDSAVAEVMTKEAVTVCEDVPLEDVLSEIQGQIGKSDRVRTIKYAVLVDKGKRPLGLIDVSKLALSHTIHWNTIGVVGLGFIGLPLSMSLAETGLKVIGWDNNEEIRETLRSGKSHISEVGFQTLLKTQLEEDRLSFAKSYDELKKCRIFIICVNTPIKRGSLDLFQLEEVISGLIGILKMGDLVILRCTVPVGTSRKLIKHIEKKTGYTAGRDFGFAFAPERTVQGRALEELRTLPQIISAINDWSMEATARTFTKLTQSVVRMGSLEEAEFVKLINNSFRDISFAFANEIAMKCESFNINATEVIKAANSGYPRNPIAMPSPGVGGLCLCKDPYLFAWASNKKIDVSLASTGRKINEQIPKNIVNRLLGGMRECGKDPLECTFFVLGFAYKGEPETNDLRNSPAMEVIKLLRDKVGTIYGYDPVVGRDVLVKEGILWEEIENGFARADAVLFMNNHKSFSKIDIYGLVKTMKRPGILFDGWSFFNCREVERIPDVRYMGLGYLTPRRSKVEIVEYQVKKSKKDLSVRL